jgi:hypothetical protein
MDQEKQRIAIAKVCGFNNIRYDWIDANSSTKDWLHDNGRGIPDYLNDLNAMHEAENLLLDNQNWAEWMGYCVKLLGVIDSMHLDQCVRATAAQRAEALLRTLNLWEE